MEAIYNIYHMEYHTSHTTSETFTDEKKRNLFEIAVWSVIFAYTDVFLICDHFLEWESVEKVYESYKLYDHFLRKNIFSKILNLATVASVIFTLSKCDCMNAELFFMVSSTLILVPFSFGISQEFESKLVDIGLKNDPT